MCCQVNVTKGTLSQAEIDAYVDHARQKYNREPLSMDIAVDGDDAEACLQALQSEIPCAAQVGYVTELRENHLILE